MLGLLKSIRLFKVKCLDFLIRSKLYSKGLRNIYYQMAIVKKDKERQYLSFI